MMNPTNDSQNTPHPQSRSKSSIFDFSGVKSPNFDSSRVNPSEDVLDEPSKVQEAADPGRLEIGVSAGAYRFNELGM